VPASNRLARRPVAALAGAIVAGWTLALVPAGPTLAQPGEDGARTISDPLEPVNRQLYAVHRVLDRILIRPVMVVYTTVLPSPARAGVRNIVGNLGEPITFVNDVLQVRPRAAGRTLVRFATNSSLGVLGLFDVAADAGYPRHYSDFGQTLGRYGVGPGPFIFVPGLGPSSLRDLGGRVADSMADPVNHVRFEGDSVVRIARPVIVGIELREFFDLEIAELDRTATDPYVTLRSAYLQNRQSHIEGDQIDVDALPSFGPESFPDALEPIDEPAPIPVAEAAAGPEIAMVRVQETFFRSH